MGSTFSPTEAYTPPRLKRTKRNAISKPVAKNTSPSKFKAKAKAKAKATPINVEQPANSVANLSDFSHANHLYDKDVVSNPIPIKYEEGQIVSSKIFSLASCEPSSIVDCVQGTRSDSSSFLLDTNNTSPGHDFLISSNALSLSSSADSHQTAADEPTSSHALRMLTPSSDENLTVSSTSAVSTPFFLDLANHETSLSELTNALFTSSPHPVTPIDELSIDQHYSHSQLNIPPSIRTALGMASSISSKLSDPSISSIFQHYIDFTCPSLDPGHHNDITQNNSIKYYLPVAVNSLSSFYGILALSCMQLREGNPQYTESALRHRTLSFHHLSKEIQEKKHLCNPAVLAGILCQLTLDVMEVKSHEWRFHLNVCRNTVKQLLGQCADYVTWFLVCRIAKYDTFASLIDLHKPIIPLASLENEPLVSHFDSVWAVPTKWAVYCATISYWGGITDRDNPEKQREMSFINAQIHQCIPFNIDTVHQSLNTQVYTIWQIATFIHHSRITYYDTRLDLIQAVRTAFASGLILLKAFPSSDFRGTAFSWPIFVFVTAAFTTQERQELRKTVSDLWRFLRITTFGEILSIADQLWAFDYESMTATEYNERIQSHLTILLA